MRRYTASTFALLTGLTGCSLLPSGMTGSSVAVPTAPRISQAMTASGQPELVLDQDPIVLTKQALAGPRITDQQGNSGVAIVWTLPDDIPWEFQPRRGIVIENPPTPPADIVEKYGLGPFIRFDNPAGVFFPCEAMGSKQYRCLTHPTIAGSKQRFKYSIHLQMTGDPKTTLDLDPNIAR